jgi:hypothetical protein
MLLSVVSERAVYRDLTDRVCDNIIHHLRIEQCACIAQIVRAMAGHGNLIQRLPFTWLPVFSFVLL